MPGVASVNLARAGVRLALLMRSVPLLQAMFTLSFGFAVYRRPWAGAVAGCLVLCWSGYLGTRAWRGWGADRDPFAVYLADVAVSVAALVILAAAVPPAVLTTSFFWAAPYAQVVLLLVGLSMPWWIGGGVLALVAATYFVVVAAAAGTASLPVAAGNAAGMAAYFGLGTVVGRYTGRLNGVLTRAARQTEAREARLGVLRARAEEFARLHDDAVQVLERAAGGEPGSAEMRAYASWAAARLRAAVSPREPTGSSLLEALGTVAQGFGAFGFCVRVIGDLVPCPGARAASLLTAAVIEALNNACKHSGADGATVEVSGNHDSVVVTVEDHGRGFPAESTRHGFGLANSIFRRLEDAGGGAALRSAPGTGTTIWMWLPC
jgi:signal transduction histidine kinase